MSGQLNQMEENPTLRRVSQTWTRDKHFSFTIGDAHLLKVRQDLQIMSRLVFFISLSHTYTFDNFEKPIYHNDVLDK